MGRGLAARVRTVRRVLPAALRQPESLVLGHCQRDESTMALGGGDGGLEGPNARLERRKAAQVEGEAVSSLIKARKLAKAISNHTKWLKAEMQS